MKFFVYIGQDKIIQLLSFYEISSINGYYCEDLDNILNFWKKKGDITYDYAILKICNSIDYIKAFKMCGQKTYLEWFEKYMKENNT